MFEKLIYLLRHPKKYKTTDSISLFNEQETYQKLSSIGNPLENICNVVDFEMFRETLEAGLLNKNKKNNAGAKPYDVVMMFTGASII